MPHILAILLTILAGAEPAAPDPEWGIAPNVGPLDLGGLPPARRAPGHGSWNDAAGDAVPPIGTFLPAPLDRALLERLERTDRYPALCQAAINWVKTVDEAELSGALDVCRTGCAETARIEKPQGIPLWVASVGAAIVLVVGGSVGYSLALIAR